MQQAAASEAASLSQRWRRCSICCAWRLQGGGVSLWIVQACRGDAIAEYRAAAPSSPSAATVTRRRRRASASSRAPSLGGLRAVRAAVAHDSVRRQQRARQAALFPRVRQPSPACGRAESSLRISAFSRGGLRCAARRARRRWPTSCRRGLRPATRGTSSLTRRGGRADETAQETFAGY